MCKLLFVSMCVLLGLLMNYCRLICYLFKFEINYVFSLVLVFFSYFSNVSSTYYMEMK